MGAEGEADDANGDEEEQDVNGDKGEQSTNGDKGDQGTAGAEGQLGGKEPSEEPAAGDDNEVSAEETKWEEHSGAIAVSVQCSVQ